MGMGAVELPKPVLSAQLPVPEGTAPQIAVHRAVVGSRGANKQPIPEDCNIIPPVSVEVFDVDHAREKGRRPDSLPQSERRPAQVLVPMKLVGEEIRQD